MFDLDDLLDYTQDDCVIDLYDCDSKDYDCVAKGLSIYEAREWASNHSYELYSFEPIQRKDENGEVVFGILFNLGSIEEA